jgi:PPOX class probable F420-dependent enzyme
VWFAVCYFGQMSDVLPDALQRARYLSLATFRRDGRAVETPVWFAEHAGHLYVFSEAKAGKMKRLRNDSRVRVAACGALGTLRGEWLVGSARRVTNAVTVKSAYAALHRKYGLQMAIGDFFSRLTGRIHARAMIEIDLESFDA